MIAAIDLLGATPQAFGDWIPLAQGEIFGAIFMILFIVISIISQIMGNKDKAKGQGGDQQPKRPGPIENIRRQLSEALQPPREGQPAHIERQKQFEQSSGQPIMAQTDDTHTIMDDRQVGTLGDRQVGSLTDRHLESRELGDRITRHDQMLDAGLVDHEPGGTESFDVARSTAPSGAMAAKIVYVFSDPQRVSEAIILAEVLRRPTERW